MTATDLRTPEAEPRLLGRPRAAAVLLRAAGRQAGWSFGSRIVTTDVHGRRAPRRARVRDLANWDLQGDGTIVVATSLKGRVALARISPRSTARSE